jgi:hypothetical protein
VEGCRTALYAEREAFSHLLTEPDRLEDDLKSGFLAIEGERTPWMRLGRLLRSSGGVLTQRAQHQAESKPTNRRFKPWR